MFLHIFLLVSALCLDTFVASAAYGANQVRLSWKQILAVNGICSLCLGVFCKHFLEKNAKYFWRMLHLQIGESCKASAGSYSASYIAIADHI